MATNVARNSPNTVVLPAVKVYLRHYPGADTAGAIANTPFALRAGTTSVSGNTDGDGMVPTRIPVGQTVTLEVFGSQYDLRVLPGLEDIATLKGAKRRLLMLGYRPGAVDATIALEADLSLLKFQADQALADLRGFDNTQAVNTATRDQLRTVVGE